MSKAKKKKPTDYVTKTIWKQEDLDMYKQQSSEHLYLYLQGLMSISKRQDQQPLATGIPIP